MTITIPPEAIEAAARTFTANWDGSDPGWKEAIRDKVAVALRAGIGAWPNAVTQADDVTTLVATPAIILPLPQEARDE